MKKMERENGTALGKHVLLVGQLGPQELKSIVVPLNSQAPAHLLRTLATKPKFENVTFRKSVAETRGLVVESGALTQEKMGEADQFFNDALAGRFGQIAVTSPLLIDVVVTFLP